MLKIISEEKNLIHIKGEGKITGNDYETILIPLVENKLKEFEKVSLLYHLGAECEGFELAALWDDAKVGLMHLTQWEKIALVSEIDWIIKAVKMLGFLIPCPIKIFTNEQLLEAEKWLKESP